MKDPRYDKTTRPARETPGSGRPRALAIAEGGTLRVIPLPETGTVDIGRSEACTVHVPDESVSRKHARLTCSASVVVVEDLESRNGMRLFGGKLGSGTATTLPATGLLQVGDVPLILLADAGARAPVAGAPRPEGPIVADPKMRDLHALIDVVAPSDISVLVLGETGTGKEAFAAEIHARSRRASGKFLCLNCAALPESLLEAELFGHERGAFTGATHARPGLFESANGGTVFLDEFGEMPPSTQAKLLRVLESGEVMRIGARTPITVDVRVVAATNKDLGQAIALEKFRSDLYFRVAGFTFTLPPLRERPTDVVALTDHFVLEACAKAGRVPLTVGAAARAALARHPFPGNVRELKAAVTRACVVAKGHTLQPDDLGLSAPDPSASGVEATRIQAALEAAGGNQTRAATALGMSRATLLRRLDALGLVRPRKGR